MGFAEQSRIVLAAVWIASATAAWAEPPLARVYREVPGAGALSPRAELVESGQRVQTVNEPAVVHLANRQVLRLDANSAIKLEAGATADDVRVEVVSGRVTTWSRERGVLEAGAGSWFLLPATLDDPAQVEELLQREPAANDRAARRRLQEARSTKAR